MHCQEKYKLHNYQVLEQYLLKLAEDKILTTVDFFMKTPEDIMLIADMSKKDYLVISNEIFSKCRPESTALYEKLLNQDSIMSTGIKKLDKILGGGIYGGELLEVYGLPATGKTQMCLHIAASCSQQHKDLSILYLDLKNDFDPLRVHELSGGSREKIERVHLFRESKIKDVINILEDYESKLRMGNSIVGENLRFIIVDSLPMTFYLCDSTCDDSLRIYQEQFVQVTTRIAARYKVAVVMTNHAVADNFHKKGNTLSSASGQCTILKPALGRHWVDFPNFRLFLSGTHNEFSATLCKSQRTKEGVTFKFVISSSGIV